MRLLSFTAEGDFEFRSFDRDHPAYAILSHTWSAESSEEVTFKDLASAGQIYKAKPGFRKLLFCAEQARKDGMLYCWVDTCCINKSDFTELNEAINSMYRWYREAARCYVYLEDVPTGIDAQKAQRMSTDIEIAFRAARWFTRGWTLQELIAPHDVVFFAQDGTALGSKKSLVTMITEITNIPSKALQGEPLCNFTHKEREAWAANRCTTREEDRVYSMFGILDVYMPLIYGEMYDHAYKRLRQELNTRESLGAGERSQARKFSVFATNPRNPGSAPRFSLYAMKDTVLRIASTHLKSSNKDGQKSRPLQKQHHPEISTTSRADHIHSRPLLEPMDQARQLEYCESPASPFERGASFRPFQYMQPHIGIRFLCYTQVTVQRTPESIRSIYDILFARHQNHWLRLKLDLTVTVDSPIWELVSEQGLNSTGFPGWRQLPSNVISKVTSCVEAQDWANDDGTVQLTLKESNHLVPDERMDVTTYSKVTPHSKRWQIQQPGFDTLRHFDLRIVTDTELVTVYVQAMKFVAHLDGRWVLCRMHSASEKSPRQLWDRFQSLMRLRGVAHTPELAGVIVDQTSKTFKGFLVNLPARNIFHAMAVARGKGDPIPLSRRLQWAHDLVKSMAHLHQRAIPADGLRTYNMAACVDSNDRALIYSPAAQIGHAGLHDFGGMLPPEYRNEEFRAGSAPTTPEFDVFQLGLLLWHLCRDRDQATSRVFCALAACQNAYLGAGRGICQHHHTNPVELPDLDEHLPKYVCRIIAASRQADPKLRPTAVQLLGMFPDDKIPPLELDTGQMEYDEVYDRLQTTTHSLNSHFVRIEDVTSIFVLETLCDVCGHRCFGESYHCDTCNQGNFDLCIECLRKDWHCDDPAHWLIQVRQSAMARDDPVSKAAYFSGPITPGKRETVFA